MVCVAGRIAAQGAVAMCSAALVELCGLFAASALIVIARITTAGGPVSKKKSSLGGIFKVFSYSVDRRFGVVTHVNIYRCKHDDDDDDDDANDDATNGVSLITVHTSILSSPLSSACIIGLKPCHPLASLFILCSCPFGTAHAIVISSQHREHHA